ncbi:MAG: SH3-like domain-containing protein [Pseudomonadota bacterium]
MISPRFRDGDMVRVIDREHRGHMRTPFYVRGHVGQIERFCGIYPNPESLAYGGDGRPERELYRVRIPQCTLWRDYTGGAKDVLEVELYEHWLEPAGKAVR